MVFDDKSYFIDYISFHSSYAIVEYMQTTDSKPKVNHTLGEH